MIKREAKFGLEFRKWLKNNPMESAYFELKQTRTNRLSYSALKPHQIDWLRAAKSSYGALYKPMDFTGVQLPCDYLYVRNGGGWVVIRYPTVMVVIDVDIFLASRDGSGSKSLTSEEAIMISKYNERH